MGVDYQAALVYGLKVDPRSVNHDGEPYEGEKDKYGCSLHRQSFYHDETEYVLCALGYWSDVARHAVEITPITTPGVVTESTIAELRQSAESRGLRTVGSPRWFLFVQVR